MQGKTINIVSRFKVRVLLERNMATHCGASFSLFVTSGEMLCELSGHESDFSYTMSTITLLIIVKSLNITYLLPSSSGSRTAWTGQHIIFSSVLNWGNNHSDLTFPVKNVFYLMYIIIFSLPLTQFYAPLQIQRPRTSFVVKGMLVFAEKIKRSESVLSDEIFFREYVT